jgi:LPPG:FO 2-phospho-L-lactate transferase
MIVVLTGGTGGAKFVDGLRQIVPAKDLTIIVNTGDDLEWWGLYVSSDLDSITYVLAGLLSKERGWGVKGDTFFCLQAMGELGEPIWFHTGDRDLAVHLLRTKLLRQGKTLTEVATEIATSMGVQARILPMCNARVETRVDTPIGELSFEEYFVQRWYQDPVNSVRFAGADKAEPAPGVIDAIMSGHGCTARSEQPDHQHWADPLRPRHPRCPEANQCADRCHQPHCWRQVGLGPRRCSDGRPVSARFHRRRGASLPGISRYSGGRCP